jgi:hypothetical protein
MEDGDDIILLDTDQSLQSPSPVKKRNFKEISKRTSPILTRSRSIVLIPSPSKKLRNVKRIQEEELSCISVVKRNRVNKCIL